jgi:hypothetical protein
MAELAIFHLAGRKTTADPTRSGDRERRIHPANGSRLQTQRALARRSYNASYAPT